MNIVDLTEEQSIGIEGTSRGTQKKWLYKNFWYKEDYLGYEALAECISSKILQQSNVPDYVVYSPVKIKYENTYKTGCKSKNFRKNNVNLMPLQKLYRIYEGENLSRNLAKIHDVTERISYVVNFVEKKVGLNDFGVYLTSMLEFDGIILNEDRHLNNISVMISDLGKAEFCPIFDNGISLLSDLNSYPLNCDIYQTISKLESKPFSRDFSEQVEAAQSLYKSQLIIKPCKGLIIGWLDELSDYYDDAILTRAENVLREQFRVWNIK